MSAVLATVSFRTKSGVTEDESWTAVGGPVLSSTLSDPGQVQLGSHNLTVFGRLLLPDDHQVSIGDRRPSHQELMDKVKNDAAAETARKELELALESQKITTKIAWQSKPSAAL